MPYNILWMRRVRVLRRLLKKYRDAKKINKNIYHKLYLGAKGNQFKNKNVLVESIHKLKQEKIREADLAAQGEARRAKNQVQKEKRLHRKSKALGEIAESHAEKPAGKPSAEKSEQRADAKRKAKIAEKKATKKTAAPKPKAEKPKEKAEKPKAKK